MSDPADMLLLMTDERMPELAQLTGAHEVTPDLRRRMIDCWIAVTNSGGAAGFPFPPVQDEDVAPVMDKLLGCLHPRHSRLITASFDGVLAGWVALNRNPSPLVRHWGTVNHLQTHPEFRCRGVGSSLMRHLRKVARDELELEQLHLAARGGAGLEDFYGQLGWREVGRWPGALRLTPGDTRDEVLMLLAPL